MRLCLLITLVTVMLYSYGSSIPLPPLSHPSPTPIIAPSPDPTPIISPGPIPSPTPWPEPAFNTASYLPPVEAGPTIHVSLSANVSDLGVLINQADAELTKHGGGTLSIKGGGAIQTQVILSHHTVFDSGTYSCEVQNTDAGQFLVSDGVLVEGNNTQFLEPTFARGTSPGFFNPAIIVFQARGDACCSHTGQSKNIAIKGIRVTGRQTHYDGGIRSTIQFGNCVNCLAQDITLQDTAGIGVSFGGSALKTDNHAKHDLAIGIKTSGVAAANVACVNCEDFILTRQVVTRPGHHVPAFGGGVSGFDLETNSPADWAKDIFVFGNSYNYEGAFKDAAGSGIVVQSPYSGSHSGNVVIANNRIVGGITEAHGQTIRRFMTSCLFVNGLNGVKVINNYCFKTGQDGLQWYGGGKDSLVQDNFFDSVGGGGSAYSIGLKGVAGVIFRRNRFDPDVRSITWSSSPGIVERDVKKVNGKCVFQNVYEANFSISYKTADFQPICP